MIRNEHRGSHYQYVLVALIIIIGLIAGCQKPIEDDRIEVTFRINDSLLDSTEVVVDGRLSLNPPRGWYLQSESTDIGTASVMIPGVSPDQVYMLEDSSASLTIGDLVIDGVSLDSAGAAILGNLRVAFGTEKNIEAASLRHRELLFEQYLVQDSATVEFLIATKVNDSTLVLLDYVIRRDRYPQLVASVESSIGSIRNLRSSGR